MQPTVSIITITQYCRHEYLKILKQIIQKQTYSNILEWIIVEGSKSDQDRKNHKICMEDFIQNSTFSFPIHFVDTPLNTKLGELRNIGNNQCQGDITVCFDDDDYYPKTRVEEAVRILTESNNLIAGCSGHYMYDYNLEKLYVFQTLKPNHSINSNMAWKKEYLKNHQHDPSKDFAEESSFTNNFTEPMEQIHRNHCAVISSHKNNTFNKKPICVEASLKNLSHCSEVDKDITEYIPKHIFEQYNRLGKYPINVDFDIVYFTGGKGITWSPTEKSLGGSEQAIQQLSENWVKSNKSVCVYTTVEKDCIVNGVYYKQWKSFPYGSKFKTLIAWRVLGIIYLAPFTIKADKIFADLHDNNYVSLQNVLQQYPSFHLDKIFYKSKYHYESHVEHPTSILKSIPHVIIPNGIRMEVFKNQLKEPNVRNLYRFCYCSCYTRGLQHILENIWPVIYKFEPRSELHVYYGMDMITNKEWKQHMKQLLAQPGVMDHGRQSAEIIAREKRLSMFQLYITNTIKEIDCISIRESIVSGCIPLLSNFGVFKERDGIHFELIDGNLECYKNIAFKILNLLKNADKLQSVQQLLYQSKWIFDWNVVSEKWLDIIDFEKNNHVMNIEI